MSISRWMDKEDMVYVYIYTHTHIYTMEYYSARTKNAMPFVATWIELRILILSEIRQRKPNTIWYHLYVESEFSHKRTYLRSRNRLTERASCSWRRDGGGMDWECEINRCQLLCMGWRNKVLLQSRGSYIQYPMTNRVCVCTTAPLCCTPEN